MKRLFIIVLLLQFALPPRANAYYYKQYTASNHLISNRIYHSYLDRKGYMWFFSDKGVSKFDGESFKNFTVFDGLGDNDVFSGYEDRSGRLWLYTYNGTPCFIRNDTVFNANNDSLLKKMPVLSYMTTILEDKNNDLYVAYFHGSLLKISNNTPKWIYKDLLIENDRLWVAHLNNDTLEAYCFSSEIYFAKDKWAGQKHHTPILTNYEFKNRIVVDSVGATIYDTNNRKVIFTYKDSYLNQMNVSHLYYDQDGYLFWCTKSGLYIIDVKTGNKTRLFENIAINSVAQDKNKNYWVATVESGIYLLHKELDEIKPTGVSPTKTYTLKNGQVFLKEKTNVYYLNDATAAFEKLPLALAGNEDPLFISNEYFFYNNEISTYYLDRHNNTKHQIQPQSCIRQIYSAGPAQFICVGRNFVSQLKFVNGRHSVVNYYFMSNESSIHKNCFDNRHTVFYARKNYLYSYDINHLATPVLFDSLNRYQFVENIYYFNNSLAIITNDQKIIFYDFGRDVKKTVLENLPFVCYDISIIKSTKGDQYILNSNKGYYLASGLHAGTRTFQKIEYPLTEPDLVLLHSMGEKILCNMSGSFYIFPENLINKDKRKPVFFISKREVNGKQVFDDNIIVKNSLGTHLVVRLNSLKFNSIALKYEYKIMGKKPGIWYSTPSEVLNILLDKFENYTIEIRAVTENNSRSPSQFIYLTILPPFYLTIPFFIAVGILLFIVVFYLIRLYNRHKRTVFENELVYLQLEHKAINSLLNPHFIFNAINNIQNLINGNSKETANKYLAILSKLIRQNIENLQFSFISVSKELNLINNYIHLQNLRFNNKIELDVIGAGNGIGDVMIPPLLIHTFVENAVVHGFKKINDDFKIIVELSLSVDDYLIIRVVDNGVGLSAKKNNPIITDKLSLGIEFIRKRLSRLSEFYHTSYTLEINNLPESEGTGTEVLIILYAKFDKTAVSGHLLSEQAN